MKLLIFSLFNLVSMFYSWCQKFCIQSKTKTKIQIDFFRFEYARSGNPTRKVLETCLASLDGATHAMTFASG
jgi:cystathionine beta-lyase/cystathionine gamma-synthase